jgi:predicted short-subunit dehydrogenase-like oxidoreductase (DUF2520 family)
MLRVVLIGTGNISKFLFDVFRPIEGVEVVQVAGRNPVALEYFKESASVTTNFSDLVQADIYILAVSDEAIRTVSHQLGIKNGLLVHTAGSISLEVLPQTLRRGVFYPLQTLSGIIPEKIREIPFCIEASSEADYVLLGDLAHCITNKVERVSSEQRRQLHLAAVFANNFSNHMYWLSSEICSDHGVSFDLLRPLIRETCEKIMQLSPFEAQTGPARRGDQKIIREHINMLENQHLKEIYTILSKSIERTYGSKL